MLLGEQLPGVAYDDYRFVEADLYGICDRVIELDPDARLVRRNDGELALARREPMHLLITGGEWGVARFLNMRGEPDGRVLHIMRASDVRRWRSPRDWARAVRDSKLAAEAARREAWRDSNGDMAEQYVHHHVRNEVGSRPMIAVPRGV